MRIYIDRLKHAIYEMCGQLRTTKRLALFGSVALVLLLLMPNPAAAIFGLGDVVFDPTSYATLGKIWTSDANTLVKVTEEVAQLDKIYSNGIQLYNQAMAMAQRVSHMNRMNWLTMSITAVDDATQNRYGESANWAALVNGNRGLASSAWRNATLAINTDTSSLLSRESLGNSGHLANLASLEAADGSSTKYLSEISEYRSTSLANSLAVQNLQTADNDDGDDMNSEIEQLNLVNGAHAVALHEQQSQGMLHACLVEQQVLSNAWQRNATAEVMNTYGTAIQARQSNATEYGDVQDTYYHYIPQ